jgi:two-component system, NarL family, nitrate/nitrite response regulator NarL
VRILLCDNHRLLVEALAASLRRLGHHVVAMTTLPEEAFDAAVEFDPDVCLLDVVFPGGHGIDTVASIRATTRSKVLVLSAQCDDDAVCAALAAGAGGFVGKNQGIDDVVRSLDQVCAGKVIRHVEAAPGPVRAPGRPRPPELVALRFLTGREREALRLIAEGQSTKEIAQSMHVAYSTARTHVQNVLTKLGVRSRLRAAALASRAGVVEQLYDRTEAGGEPPGAGSDNCRSRTPTKGGGTGARLTAH